MMVGDFLNYLEINSGLEFWICGYIPFCSLNLVVNFLN